MAEQHLSHVPIPLSINALRRTCTEEEITFLASEQHTAVPAPDDLFIGVDQGRFTSALEFGLHESSQGHIFVTGLSGPRALNAIKKYVGDFLAAQAGSYAPQDWCYLHNFTNPLEPISVHIGKGRGKSLKDRMAKLLLHLQEHVHAALTRDDIVAQRQQKTSDLRNWWESLRLGIIRDAKREGIYVNYENEYTIVRPLSRLSKQEKDTQEKDRDGKERPALMQTEEVDALEPQERKRSTAAHERWIHRVNMSGVEYQKRSRETREAITALDRGVVCDTVEEAFKEIGFKSSEKVSSYGQQLKDFAIDHFTPQYEEQQNKPQIQNPELPWNVNVLVDSSEQQGPPIVVDYDGTFQSLVGRIERVANQNGIAYTDHTMIGPGSIVEANGGYLIVDAMNVLRNTGSYDVLKRVMNNAVLRIEDPMSFYGMGSTVPLQPAPIPIKMKVIMLGSLYIWHMLAHYDPEFLDHFELKAEVTSEVEWNTSETSALAQWTTRYAKSKSLLPFDNGALQRIVEHAGRLADNQQKLSTDYRSIEPIVHEASYIALKDQQTNVSAIHVRQALEKKFYRSNFRYQRMQQMIRDKIILLPLKGERVGQITILAVADFGDMRIGMQNRLTAGWSIGRPGFISLHREAGLAGDILKKGEMTVQSALLGLFAKRYPMAVNITYTAEQTYNGIDGDSASMALFYAIVSSLSGVPIRQDIAITGSLSQWCEPQAIGGLNEKIEGFFDTCAFSGLTGTQGVIFPEANASDLMLNERVIDAANAGQFSLWACRDISHGMQILMGKESGVQNPDYTFADGSVYDLVDKQLQTIARNARNFMRQEKPEDDGI
ncbi:MAG: AAA family ATPase [bacterium]|nr:AAA family ATPase [bacterium]